MEFTRVQHSPDAAAHRTGASRAGRRPFVAVAAALALVAVTAACGSGGEKGGEATGTGTGGGSASAGTDFSGQTLTWAINPVSANKEKFDQFYDTVAERFHEETGATLKYQPNQTSASDVDQLIAQIAATKSGPDMISTGTTKIPAAYFSGAFHEFTSEEWDAIGGQDQFYPGALGPGGPDTDHVVGVPRFMFPYAMAYNTKLFEEAGIDAPPTTWDEFVEYAQKITDADAGVYGATMQPADEFAPWTTLWWYIKELGTDYISEDGKTALLDSPQVKEAMKFWWDWYQTYKIVDPNSLNWTREQADAAFADGKVGMEFVVSTAQIPLYREGAVGDDFAFAPMPQLPLGLSELPEGGVAPGTFTAGHMIVVAQHANVPLALEFLKLYLSPEIQRLQYQLVGYLPSVQSVGEELKSSDPVLEPFFDLLNTQVSTPFSAAFPSVEGAMSSASARIAAEIAERGSASSDFIDTALDGANVAVAEQLDE